MISNDEVRKLSERIAERGEQFRRQAIRETDWTETAILRIIERQPDLLQPMDWGRDNKKFTVKLPVYEAERYREKAPPVSEHADGKRRCSVQTVTKPLLDKVGGEYPELFEDTLD